MRIANGMITNNYLYSLNNSLSRQADLQEKLADGKAIHRPSDDPIKAIRALRFQTNAAMNTQYTQNVKDAISWMETTDGAMSDLSSIVIKAKELVIDAVSPNSPDVYQAYGAELDGMINQMIQIGNSQLGDRYIFGGQNDKTLPFTRTTDANGNEVVVYSGDSNRISMTIQPGMATPSADSVNLTGSEVFGPLTTSTVDGNAVQTVSFLNDLLKIKNELMQKNNTLDKRPISQSNLQGADLSLSGTYSGTGNPNIAINVTAVSAAGAVTEIKYSTDYNPETKTGTWTTITAPAAFTVDGINLDFGAPNTNTKVGDTYMFTPKGDTTDLTFLANGASAIIDAGHTQALHAQTQLGARMSMYEMSQSLLESNYTNIINDLAANEDLDVPRAIIDFQTSENVYKAALAVGAKIMPLSLVDFLK